MSVKIVVVTDPRADISPVLRQHPGAKVIVVGVPAASFLGRATAMLGVLAEMAEREFLFGAFPLPPPEAREDNRWERRGREHRPERQVSRRYLYTRTRQPRLPKRTSNWHRTRAQTMRQHMACGRIDWE